MIYQNFQRKIPRIKKLKLKVNDLKIKADFKEFSSLEEVDLSGNKNLLRHFDFSTLPKNLKILILRDCGLEKTPDLSKFEKLEVLDLSENIIVVLDKKFLPSNLKKLILQDNVGPLPNLGDLNIKELDISNSEFSASQLPKKIVSLNINFTIQNLRKNFEGFENLINLQEIIMNFSDFNFLKKHTPNIQRLFLRTPDNKPIFSVNLSHFRNLEVISCNSKVFELFSSQKKLINYIKDKYPQSIINEILDIKNPSGEQLYKKWDIDLDKAVLSNKTVRFENQDIIPKEAKELQERLFQFMTKNNGGLFIDKTSRRGFKLNYQRVREDPFLEKSLLDILRHNPVEDEEFNNLESRYRRIAEF